MLSAPNAPKKCKGRLIYFSKNRIVSKIEEDAEGAGNAVMGLAPFPDYILDRNLTNAGAVPGSKRRNEAMHFTIQRNIVNDLAAVRLEGRSEIVNLYAGKFGHQPVRTA